MTTTTTGTCQVRDTRSGSVLSPYSTSWRSSDTEKRASLSVPFLHFWLPPRQQQTDPGKPSRSGYRAPSATATAAPTTLPARVVKKHSKSAVGRADSHDGSARPEQALPGEAQRTMKAAVWEREAYSAAAAHGPPSSAVAARSVAKKAASSPPHPSPFYLAGRNAPPLYLSPEGLRPERSVSALHFSALSLSPAVPSTLFAPSPTCSSTPLATKRAVFARRAGDTPSADQSHPHPHDNSASRSAPTTVKRTRLGKDQGKRMDLSPSPLRPATADSPFAGVRTADTHLLTSIFTPPRPSTSPSTSSSTARGEPKVELFTGHDTQRMPPRTNAAATTAAVAPHASHHSSKSPRVLAAADTHAGRALHPATRDGNCGNCSGLSSAHVVNEPLYLSTNPPHAKGEGVPYTESVTCMTLAAMVDVGVALRSCSCSQSTCSYASYDSAAPDHEVRLPGEEGEREGTEGQGRHTLAPQRVTCPPHLSSGTTRRASDALRSSNHSNQLNGGSKLLDKLSYTQPAPTRARGNSSSSSSSSNSNELQSSSTSRPPPSVRSTAGESAAAASKPARKRGSVTSRLYSPPLSTPLTSFRYRPRTSEEEREIAELQASLAAFVFPLPARGSPLPQSRTAPAHTAAAAAAALPRRKSNGGKAKSRGLPLRSTKSIKPSKTKSSRNAGETKMAPAEDALANRP
ncbi:hypothetical protein ABL78_7477 [Leptomonas seymouri]|uniref:Uncharacterized protein n=1 Tax=Leptomonas seymouri TaxID=5684 RepID=A0A0N1HTX5_LEPSE|nr:hypothetical protein ABL78_7477 [Leptomonas seymouri]|eukprot:KPI83490.1 hypothetical protein ABL78_7477 [Leptomonas seymouri]